MEAIERGVVFEVTYAAAIRDSTMRRYTIANANVMMDICKGKVCLLPMSGHILQYNLACKGRQSLKHLHWLGCVCFSERDPVQRRWDCESAFKKQKQTTQIHHQQLIRNWLCVSSGSGDQRTLWCHQSVSFRFHHLWLSPVWRSVCVCVCVWYCSPDLTPSGLLFGLSDGDAKEAISSTCRSAVLHAGNFRRTSRTE